MVRVVRVIVAVSLTIAACWSAASASLAQSGDSGSSKTAGETDQQKSSQGQEDTTEEKLPPARRRYMGRTIAQTMSHRGAGWLIRDSRDQEERPREALRALQLKPGMTVCDMGCGNGFWTLLMSEKVGDDGKVLAVDIQPEMLSLLRARCKEAKVTNVKPVLGGLADPHLDDESVDLLLMVDVYHEFSYPKIMLQNIRKALKDDGVIALLEYRAEDPRVPILPLHKMSRKQILREYEANGYKLVRQYTKLPWQHLMFFGKDPDWKPEDAKQP
ncbi:MAG TPA: class I SAM-dependent methyltransferase [Planctomycetaceae bacterium]|nr:class I SAM-dependent methyltransferase [Planctomycetaceae bacterium]